MLSWGSTGAGCGARCRHSNGGSLVRAGGPGPAAGGRGAAASGVLVRAAPVPRRGDRQLPEVDGA
jgi:hypothetical protein